MRERQARGKSLDRRGQGCAPGIAAARSLPAAANVFCFRSLQPWRIAPYSVVWAGMSRPDQRLKEQHVSTGTVKWFNETKGYGFITPDQGGSDVFVHISAVERSGLRGLNEGQKISYDLEADRKTGKSSAVNLKTA